MIEAPKATNLSTIMRNRRELRKRGVTPAALLVLESIARAAPEGMARVSVAAVGRMVGIGRASALAHVRRLEALGLVVRMGPAMMVCARSVLRVAADAVKGRAQHLKRLYDKKKAQATARMAALYQSGSSDAGRDRPASFGDPVSPDRAAARAELQRLYVPVHLRQAKGAGG